MIAVAVDGSEASVAALERALLLAREQEGPLQGLFVLDTGWADYIGNDWQSSRNARQGFLDYVQKDLETHARRAKAQFEQAAEGWGNAEFEILYGDPLEALCAWINKSRPARFILGQEVFRICGRPSVNTLPEKLPHRVTTPVIVV